MKPFIFDLLSLDYTNRNAVYDMRQRLEGFLRPTLTCECLSVRDEDIIPMGCDGRDERFFATVEEVKRHSDLVWWLSLNACRACGQHWLIAQEERIFDDYFVNRAIPRIIEDITIQNIWPAGWLTYEGVLKTGRTLSKHCRFLDPMAKSLVWTARDLKQARPGISVEEIAELLGVEIPHAEALLTQKP